MAWKWYAVNSAMCLQQAKRNDTVFTSIHRPLVEKTLIEMERGRRQPRYTRLLCDITTLNCDKDRASMNLKVEDTEFATNLNVCRNLSSHSGS
jgi:hypothetical protein